jgi:hypothetical protein
MHVRFAFLSQVGIELIQVFDLRNRRSPVSLEPFDASFNMRFFIATCWHAKHRREVIVTCQCLVLGVEFTFASVQDRLSDGLRVVPPKFTRYAAKELERFDSAMQNRFGLFAW